MSAHIHERNHLIAPNEHPAPAHPPLHQHALIIHERRNRIRPAKSRSAALKHNADFRDKLLQHQPNQWREKADARGPDGGLAGEGGGVGVGISEATPPPAALHLPTNQLQLDVSCSRCCSHFQTCAHTDVRCKCRSWRPEGFFFFYQQLDFC